MAAHAEEDAFEYVADDFSRIHRSADALFSYESLPPNFSLAANMAAGAFAGIAVCAARMIRPLCPC